VDIFSIYAFLMSGCTQNFMFSICSFVCSTKQQIHIRILELLKKAGFYLLI